MSKGLLFVISSPSGGGKTTLINKVLKEMKRVAYSISVTTRPPRRVEKNGREYYFISEKEFQKWKRSGQLLEYAFVHGYWYGTPRKYVQKKLNSGYDVLLDIDVQGGMQVKKTFPEAVLIFITPPSLSVLESRLRGRHLDDEDAIRRRLKGARREYGLAHRYNYFVMNDRVPEAFEQLKSVITAERLRMSRNYHLIKR